MLDDGRHRGSYEIGLIVVSGENACQEDFVKFENQAGAFDFIAVSH